MDKNGSEDTGVLNPYRFLYRRVPESKGSMLNSPNDLPEIPGSVEVTRLSEQVQCVLSPPFDRSTLLHGVVGSTRSRHFTTINKDGGSEQLHLVLRYLLLHDTNRRCRTPTLRYGSRGPPRSQSHGDLDQEWEMRVGALLPLDCFYLRWCT